jgi:hypothetical protein
MLAPGKKNVTLHLKNKRAGGGAQVVDCQSSKHKALSSKPSTVKKEKKIPYLFSELLC